MAKAVVGLVALLLVSFQPQEPADKVRALVEQLVSGDIETRDRAQAELIKIGPSALPALRKHLAAADGELKARLEVVIPKLERAERFAHFLAPGPTITLKAKDRPAAEVIAEIAKQAEVPVDGAALPAGTLLSLDADRMSLPAVIDEVCRRHGGIMHQWSATRVCLLPAAYRPRRIFSAGAFHFMPDGFMWSCTRGREDWSSFRLCGLLVGPPGRLPPELKLGLEAVDDKGNKFGATSTRHGLTLGELEWPGERRFCRMVQAWAWPAPALDAAKMTTCRGDLRLTFILGARKILTHKVALSPENFQEGTSIHIGSCVRDGRILRAEYSVMVQVDDERPDQTPGPTWLALHDKNGHRLEGREEAGVTLGDDEKTMRASGVATFDLPEGFEPVSIDVMEAADFEEIRIPFDLGEVRLR